MYMITLLKAMLLQLICDQMGAPRTHIHHRRLMSRPLPCFQPAHDTLTQLLLLPSWPLPAWGCRAQPEVAVIATRFVLLWVLCAVLLWQLTYSCLG